MYACPFGTGTNSHEAVAQFAVTLETLQHVAEAQNGEHTLEQVRTSYTLHLKTLQLLMRAISKHIAGTL